MKRASGREAITGARRALLCALLGLALIGLWQGLSTARSSLAMRLLEMDIRNLEARPELAKDPQQLQHVREQAARVADMAGSNVEALELIARSHWLAAAAAPEMQAQIREWRLAREALHQALARRSSWPYTWLLLARVEFSLAPRGPAGPIALRQALSLGLRGYRLQVQLLELRKDAEDYLDPALLAQVQAAYLQGLREHGTQLAENTQRLGRFDWSCAEAPARAQLEDWCQRWERWLQNRRR